MSIGKLMDTLTKSKAPDAVAAAPSGAPATIGTPPVLDIPPTTSTPPSVGDAPPPAPAAEDDWVQPPVILNAPSTSVAEALADLSPVRLAELKALAAPEGSTFTAGGMAKQTAGKLDMRRGAPEWPVYLAAHMAKGGEKGYPLDNWRKPGTVTDLAVPMYRHILDYLAGNDTDPKDGSDILAAIAANALMLRSKRDAGTLTDDRLAGPPRPAPAIVKALLYPGSIGSTP